MVKIKSFTFLVIFCYGLGAMADIRESDSDKVMPGDSRPHIPWHHTDNMENARIALNSIYSYYS